jgi:hypothetical protein
MTPEQCDKLFKQQKAGGDDERQHPGGK